VIDSYWKSVVGEECFCESWAINQDLGINKSSEDKIRLLSAKYFQQETSTLTIINKYRMKMFSKLVLQNPFLFISS